MKLLLPTLLLFISYFSFGQNYDCLQFGPKPYFINGDGYVRGMRIDSVTTVGSDVVYHPFRSSRLHDYSPTYWTPTDTFGASWLGKDVIKKSDGTFIFDNKWDTVFIKTQAHVGDSWMFFNDTTIFHYTATVTAEDTMTFLGVVDSVKKITIGADSSGFANSNDPVHGFEIILSKNNGFVQVFDLYTFPYHYPNSIGLTRPDHRFLGAYADYYLDVVLGSVNGMVWPAGLWTSAVFPNTVNSIFRLFPFHNPTYAEINDFSTGDVVETHYLNDMGGGDGWESFTLDSVTSTDGVLISEITQQKIVMRSHGLETMYHYSTDTNTNGPIDTSQLFSDYHMPEEGRNGYIIFYKAKDYLIVGDIYYPVVCDSAPSYTFYTGPRENGWSSPDFGLQPSWSINKWMLGFGDCYSQRYNALAMMSTFTNYSYINKSGHRCGTRIGVAESVRNYNEESKLIISPNPATDHVTITADRILDNATVSAYDMTGRHIVTEQFRSTLILSTSNWPKGVYLITISSGTNIVRRERVVIE